MWRVRETETYICKFRKHANEVINDGDALIYVQVELEHVDLMRGNLMPSNLILCNVMQCAVA